MINKLLFFMAFFGLAFLFHFNPSIDLAISGHFYGLGRGFYLSDNFFAVFARRVVPFIAVCFMVTPFLILFRAWYKHGSIDPTLRTKIIYVLLVCIAGPGLVVNTVFKENFGRARPIQIQEFGGESKFTPAFVISDQCQHNCSFVSGHASIGFVFFALAFINRGLKRKLYNVLAIFLGLLFGIGRIVQGAHFASDVIFSGFFVYMTAYVLAKLILPKESEEIR